MTDEEYREFLSAIARRHLRPAALADPEIGAEYLVQEAERLASLSRLVRAVAAYPKDPALCKAVADRLEQSGVKGVVQAMDNAGVLEAADEAPGILFGELRRSAIPSDDTLFLQRAGVDDPELEIALSIHHAKTQLSTLVARPCDKIWHAEDGLRQAAEKLRQSAKPMRPKRKIFNGIGKILAGAITGAGNLMLLTGSVVAPNPAVGYGAMASSALAISSFCSGLGDLWGE